jgi:hypothetical protein
MDLSDRGSDLKQLGTDTQRGAPSGREIDFEPDLLHFENKLNHTPESGEVRSIAYSQSVEEPPLTDWRPDRAFRRPDHFDPINVFQQRVLYFPVNPVEKRRINGLRKFDRTLRRGYDFDISSNGGIINLSLRCREDWYGTVTGGFAPPLHHAFLPNHEDL